jgi:hypothetical protein
MSSVRNVIGQETSLGKKRNAVTIALAPKDRRRQHCANFRIEGLLLGDSVGAAN